MTQPLNYTPKAIVDLLGMPCTGAPLSRGVMHYLADKLRQAEVFMLPDHGELMDRSKPRPEVPAECYRPAFPIVALEYTAAAPRREHAIYTAARSSKRIALAWDWQGDALKGAPPHAFGSFEPGVVIASIYYSDADQLWMPSVIAFHIPYASAPTQPPPDTPFLRAMREGGFVKPRANAVSGSAMLMLPEVAQAAMAQLGPAGTMDHLHADLMDEVNAYLDLCLALSCRNVATERHPAPAALNRQRLRAGKLPLKDFHVLELSGGGDMPGIGGNPDGRSAARSHLRRGHIRRLPDDRVTWVNSTVVRGRRFIEKVYAA